MCVCSNIKNYTSSNIENTMQKANNKYSVTTGKILQDYYRNIVKKLKKIRSIVKITQKVTILIMDAILRVNSIYLNWKWQAGIDNYMAIFLELDFIDQCYLNCGGYFDIDSHRFTHNYYYITDDVIGAIISENEMKGIGSMIKSNLILKNKLDDLKEQIEQWGITKSWIRYGGIVKKEEGMPHDN